MLSERKPQPLVEGNEVKGVVSGIDPIFAKLRLSRLSISVNGDLGTAGAEAGLDRADELKSVLGSMEHIANHSLHFFQGNITLTTI